MLESAELWFIEEAFQMEQVFEDFVEFGELLVFLVDSFVDAAKGFGSFGIAFVLGFAELSPLLWLIMQL